MMIPRLELQAAVLGTRLMDRLGDSAALDWQHAQALGNRVAEILESTNVAQWRCLPSADNGADDATRSQCSVDLSEKSRWLRGPAFLRRPAGSWPGAAPADDADGEDEEEMPCDFALVVGSDTFRFSSYRRLLRTTVWVLRFTRRCRGQRDELENDGLTVAEGEAAENLLVLTAQREVFPDEMRAAENGLDVAKGSDICGLAPYLDGNGVLRVYGRIDAALYRSAPRGQCVISGCSECKLHITRPMPPIMGPLPEDRLEASGWPFKSAGLDCFEPLLVTVAQHQEKRWVALFTCLTTRAIHLELAHDLSRDSCIIVIRNFMCRRGPVHRLRSVNGKNFGDDCIKQFCKSLKEKTLSLFYKYWATTKSPGADTIDDFEQEGSCCACEKIITDDDLDKHFDQFPGKY
ncbi:uncharacterized protein LOC121529851, partial [Drosophila eugracilis]|uniref:uncharacterized protein LOC121529851 n=1 Tax=Drosophila eugracilis TaxID=29029 RepID=UPI001BD9B1FE